MSRGMRASVSDDLIDVGGGPMSRDDIVQRHAGLARSLAGRYAERGENLDDLTQVAYIGLVKAVDRFDPERGVQFSTYATATILGEIKRHFRDSRWTMRVPRSVQELYLRVKGAVDTLSLELGRSPTIAEIAHFSAASTEAVIEAIEAGRTFHMTSLDAPRDDESSDLVEIPSPDASLSELVERQAISSLIDRLPPREREILRLRFEHDLTQSEIAARIGVSQMQVSRLLARTLDQLRVWASHP